MTSLYTMSTRSSVAGKKKPANFYYLDLSTSLAERDRVRMFSF
jgi:hypothetical protein